MNKYLVYMTCGGVMEDPVQHDEKHLIIEAVDRDKAVEQFLVEHRLTDEAYINRGRNGFGWSYYFPITCIDITEALKTHFELRKEFLDRCTQDLINANRKVDKDE
jgi:hypothetical protein